MKKFIIQIVGILAIILILLLVFDFTYTTVYKNANPRTKFQYLRSLKNTQVNYIFLGSSRVENGIVPSIIENRTQKKSINLGYQASKMGDIYTVLQFLQFYKISTDTVFIQVDYIFNDKGNSITLPYEMIPFVHESDIAKWYFIDYLGNNKSKYFIPFIRYCDYEAKMGFREVFANIIGKKTNVLESRGFSPLQGSNEKVNIDHRILPREIVSSNIFYEKIKKFGIQNNIKIVFFCAPFCKHTKNLDYVKKLKTKIPDLYDFSTAIQADAMFVNCFHLNEMGSSKFTEIFVESILKKKQ